MENLESSPKTNLHWAVGLSGRWKHARNLGEKSTLEGHQNNGGSTSLLGMGARFLWVGIQWILCWPRIPPKRNPDPWRFFRNCKCRQSLRTLSPNLQGVSPVRRGPPDHGVFDSIQSPPEIWMEPAVWNVSAEFHWDYLHNLSRPNHIGWKDDFCVFGWRCPGIASGWSGYTQPH